MDPTRVAGDTLCDSRNGVNVGIDSPHDDGKSGGGSRRDRAEPGRRAEDARGQGRYARRRLVGAAPVGQPRGGVAARPPHDGNGRQPRQPPHRRRAQDGPLPRAAFHGLRRHKWLEAAAFEIARAPSDQLRASSGTLIELVAAAPASDLHPAPGSQDHRYVCPAGQPLVSDDPTMGATGALTGSARHIKGFSCPGHLVPLASIGSGGAAIKEVPRFRRK